MVVSEYTVCCLPVEWQLREGNDTESVKTHCTIKSAVKHMRNGKREMRPRKTAEL